MAPQVRSSDTVSTEPRRPRERAATPEERRGGTASRREAVRALPYEEGREALRPEHGPIPARPDEALELAQRSITSVGASATLEEQRTVYQDRAVEVVFDAGSRLSVRLDPMGLHFSSQPGILLKIRRAPDLRITDIRWDFASARFDCSATANWFDILGIIGAIGERKVEAVLNARLKPLLPPAVQRPGYDPSRDPNLAQTTASLSRVFDFASRERDLAGRADRDRGTAAPPHGSSESGTPTIPGAIGGLKDPSAYLSASMPEDVRVPLGSGGLELFVQKATSFFLSANASGRVERPVVQEVTLRAGGTGIVIRPTSGTFRAFKELQMKSISVRHGGQFSFDYDLSAETIGEGLYALVSLLGLAAGRDVGPIPDLKLHAIRAEIDRRLQTEVPPRFRAILQQYDRLIPGLSLKSVFGT